MSVTDPWGFVDPQNQSKNQNSRAEGLDTHSAMSIEIKFKLDQAKKNVKACHRYGEKLSTKVLEAEAFAAVWQKSGKDLRGTLASLRPILETDPIINQKLLTVLEKAEGNWQLGEEAGIALKTVSQYIEKSREFILGAEQALDEIIDSIILEFGFVNNAENKSRTERITEAVLLAKAENHTELASLSVKENLRENVREDAGELARENGTESIRENVNSQTLVFSDRAKDALQALHALTSLKKELHELRSQTEELAVDESASVQGHANESGRKTPSA